MDATGSALAREIRQTKPFTSAQQEAALGLFKTADVLKQHLSGVMEKRGITDQQYNVLRILRGAGKAGLPTLEIAARMIEKAPGITRLLDRLEAKGLVSRRRSATDRREVLCTIAGAGTKLLARMDEPVKAAGDAALSMLSGGELTTLIHLLDKIRAGLAAPDSPFRNPK
jgi:DNA-binding MarR family transcriptional regulator